MNFPCQRCGKCCEAVGKAVLKARASPSPDPVTKAVAAFPYLGAAVDYWERIGLLHDVCVYYDRDTRTCRIYDKRPDVCNTVTMYNLYWADAMTEEEWIRKSKEACHALAQNRSMS